MVLFVRWFLALPLLLVGVAAPGHAATRNAPPYLRTSLDDAAPAAPAPGPRRIRSTLDDAGPIATRSLGDSPSHVTFPPEAGATKLPGRLIRLSLDDGQVSYGHLVLAQRQPRRIRTTLD